LVPADVLHPSAHSVDGDKFIELMGDGEKDVPWVQNSVALIVDWAAGGKKTDISNGTEYGRFNFTAFSASQKNIALVFNTIIKRRKISISVFACVEVVSQQYLTIVMDKNS
jgi:hypothetical protein